MAILQGLGTFTARILLLFTRKSDQAELVIAQLKH